MRAFRTSLAAFCVFTAVVQIRATDFGKLDTSWDRLTPKPGPEKWNLGSEGFMTYTNSPGAAYLPNRHSYGWFQFYGNYQIVPQYNLSALVTVQKQSFSGNLSDEPFKLRAFPQLSFDGTLNHLLPFEGLPDSGHNIRFQAGSIPMFKHGQGLFYSQFTGVGFSFSAEFKNVSIEATTLGYGYYEGDDVQSLYVYGPRKIIGVGALSEINTPLGNRVVPGIAGEFFPVKELRLYYEGGVSFLYSATNTRQFDTYTYVNDQPQTIDLSNVSFGNGFRINDRTVSGLVGVDFATQKIFKVIDRVLFSNQFRYYGAEATDFYEKERRSHFYYFTDLTTDLRYNNQPYNFYLFPGRSMGMYFLQEIDLVPWKALKFSLRNEILVVYYENGYLGGAYNPTRSGNDLLSLTFAATIEDRVSFGAKVSNVLIGDIEYGKATVLNYQRAPLMLEASRYWLLDFYIRYRI